MTGHKKIEARREKILKSASKVFAEKGFQEATISEIAGHAGVSEPTIYDYYSTKEGLLFSIPLDAMQRMGEISDFHLKLIRGASNKIRSLLYLQLLFYKENRDFATVLMLILKQNRKFIDTVAHNAIRDYIKKFDQIIEEGIHSGEFRSDIDPFLLRSACIGAVEHVVINWLLIGYPSDDDLLDFVDPMINTLVQGIQNKVEDKGCPLEQYGLIERSDTTI